jgi:rod shape-determining protein MreC
MARSYSGKWILVVFIVIAILVSINLTSKERESLTIVERLIKDGIAPLQSGVMAVSGKVNDFFSTVIHFGDIKEENKQLRDKVGNLTSRVTQLREAELQNLRLRQALEYKEKNIGKFDLIMATVIGRNLSNWQKTITIGIGSNDGIVRNDVVANHQGLVGRVSNVSSNTSEVLLILDSTSSVSAMEQYTRTLGFVEGAPDEPGLCRMTKIPYDAKIKEKQTIMTTGLGGIFPKGIVIGTLFDVKLEPSGLTKTAFVKSAVNFDRLEEVFIVRQK